MILRSLKLENIRSYAQGTIVFPEQSTVLSGDIGSGKSTILLAIEFALFGLGNLSGSQLLRHGEKQGNVELEVLFQNTAVRIRRGLRRAKESIQQEAGWIAHQHAEGGEHWTKTEATPIELKTKMLELMGYPGELLTKSKTTLYRFTVYTPQEAMKQILLGNSNDRLDTIRKIFGIDTYARVQANATLVGKEMRNRIRQESVRAEGIDDDKKKQWEERTMQEQLMLRRDGAEHERRRLTAHTTTLKQRHDELVAQQAEAQQLNQQRAVCHVQQQEKKQHAARCTEELKNLRAAREKMQQDITKTAESRAVLEQQRMLLARRRTELTAQYTAMVGREQRLFADISRRKTTVDQLMRLHECPLCQQGVSDEHKQGIVQREMPLARQAEQELITLREQKKQHDHFLRQLEQEEHQLRSRERDAMIAETTLLRLQDIDRQRVEREKMLQQMMVSLQELGVEQHRLDERLQAHAGITEQFTAVQKELEEARVQERKCAIACAELQKEINHAQAQLHLLEETIKQKEGLRKKLHRISQLETWLEEHLVRVADLIEKEVLRTVYVQFDELFKNWFSMLVEDELLQARLGDDFSVVVEQNGYETTVENLSGGEKTAVALAYRLALNKVINDIVSTIRTKNLLILDEPTDGFSAHQLDKVRTVLRELNAQQVILVSHEQKIESFVDHVIRIEKRGHESVVVR